MTVLLILLGIVLITMLILYLFPIVCIKGDSMFPTLKNGQLYSSRRLFNKSKYLIGEIYVFRPPYGKNAVIKRLIKVDYGKLYFMGDNRGNSYDSRNYGYVEPKCLIAVLNKRIH